MTNHRPRTWQLRYVQNKRSDSMQKAVAEPPIDVRRLDAGEEGSGFGQITREGNLQLLRICLGASCEDGVDEGYESGRVLRLRVRPEPDVEVEPGAARREVVPPPRERARASRVGRSG